MLNLQIPGFDASSAAATDSVASAIAESRETRAEMLKNLSLDDLINKLAYDLGQFAIHLAAAILVFYLGRFIIGKLYKLIQNIMISRDVDRSLTTFVLSLVRIVLYFILIVTVIGIVGIETSSFIALFASAGVAIGMALSGTLQNFAGGVLILLLKPYKIGDYIEAQGYNGTVTEIQIFNTIICTPDNKSIIIPNGGLSTGTINNWSREDYRRLEWSVGISYGDSVERVRAAVLEMFEADHLIVKTTLAEHREMVFKEKELETEQEMASEGEPAPEEKHTWIWRLFHRQHRRVKEHAAALANAAEIKRLSQLDHVVRKPTVTLSELADSSVNLTIRAWVPSADYWAIYYRYLELFYTELPERAGISFPFPQLDVHLPESAAPKNGAENA
nr:mechanosensitive ion channel [Bacteroides sp.]